MVRRKGVELMLGFIVEVIKFIIVVPFLVFMALICFPLGMA